MIWSIGTGRKQQLLFAYIKRGPCAADTAAQGAFLIQVYSLP